MKHKNKIGITEVVSTIHTPRHTNTHACAGMEREVDLRMDKLVGENKGNQ